MRRHKLNWIWIILLGLFVGSCEDYLDRSPDDGLSEDDVYKDYSSLLGFMDRIFQNLSLIHISEPTRRTPISYAVFCLKKKKKKTYSHICLLYTF